jgi:hypothetical protein
MQGEDDRVDGKLPPAEWKGSGPELAVRLLHRQTDGGFKPGGQTFAIARHGLRSY